MKNGMTGSGSNKPGKQIFGMITTVLCLFLAVGVTVLFHACGPKEDGTWMSCHWAQTAVLVAALVMTALSVLAVFAKKTASIAVYAAIAALAVITAVIPGNIIHLCMMNDMRCRAVMRPCVILVCVLIAAFSVISAIDRKGRTA